MGGVHSPASDCPGSGVAASPMLLPHSLHFCTGDLTGLKMQNQSTKSPPALANPCWPVCSFTHDTSLLSTTCLRPGRGLNVKLISKAVVRLVRLAFQLGIHGLKFSNKNAQRTLGMFGFNFVQDSRRFSHNLYSETLMINRPGLVWSRCSRLVGRQI